MSWDELFPNGRTVFFEGVDEDFEDFREEMEAIGITVPDGHWIPWDDNDESKGGFISYSFRIPAGRVEEIYGNSDWPLGS